MRNLFVFIFLFVGCNKSFVKTSYPTPQGKLIFSIEVLSSALVNQITGKTGYFFYLSDYSTFTIYEYKQGQIVERNGLSSRETSELFKELDQIKFEELNLETEIEKAKINWKRIADRNGDQVMGIATSDGAEYKLQFNYEKINYTLQMWNPKAQINLYSPYNKKIEKLRSVIDLFAESYGHLQFGI